MAKREELKIRLNEQIRIYKDSPNVQATFIDLARIVEDLSEIIDNEKEVGFNG